ncbi:MAG: lamin tail domain-containing protein [Ignavibacteriaceae bacterium]
MKKLLLLIIIGSLQFAFSQTDTSIIFSEIMFNAPSGDNEFIELYNSSETETFDIKNFKIIYQTSNADVIIPANDSSLLKPKSFAVILEGDYDFENGIYNSIIPAGVLVLKISDNAFGSSGMANTSDRTLNLLNNLDDTLSVYTYSANNGSGISDEKIILNRNDNSTNWANALQTNGTPGFKNSVTPIDFDLSLSKISITPIQPIENNNVTVSVKVKNIGFQNADNYTIQIFNDLNFDSTGTADELIFSQSFTNLSSGDSITANTILNSIQAGTYNIFCRIIFTNDEDTLNNKKNFSFIVFPPGNNFNDIIINEIMYAPSSGEPEWVELYNKTSSPINLKKLTLSDNSTSFLITANDFFIDPKSYVVVSRDSSILNFYSVESPIVAANFPALNNSGDAVVIKDSLGILLDSLEYLPGWGGSVGGKSLERILVDGQSVQQQNWGTSQSLNKATPGKINSITPKNFDLKVSTFEPEKDFEIIGEQIGFQIVIKNIGLNQVDNFQLEFYKDINLDSIPQSTELISSSNGNLILPNDSNDFSVSTNNLTNGENYFIAKINYPLDEDTTNNLKFTKISAAQINENRSDVIINEFMYAPAFPQPEWIELFNRSEKIINLKNYKIADDSDTISVIKNSVILNPKEYFIITRDSSIINYFNVKSNFVESNFPTLNNSGDRIILIDSLNRTIDSLEYLFTWGGTGGKSLERIDPNFISTDSASWSTSKSFQGGTPGYINSVTQKDFDGAVLKINFNPLNPFFGDEVSISALAKNIGKNISSFNLVLFEDTNLDSLPDSEIEIKQNIIFPPGDSAEINFDFKIQNLQNKRAFFVQLNFSEDEDTTNNNFYAVVSPGYLSSSIIINEVMYDPQQGEPEWIELVNISQQNINLKNWSISDLLPMPAKNLITKNDITISPNEYFIAAHDSSFYSFHPEVNAKIFIANFGTLGNTEDGIILYDFRNINIDSLNYKSAWGGGNGFSLERISFENETNDSSNWTSSLSINKSTPGKENSINKIQPGKRNDLIINEIMFDPDIDNCEFIEFFNLSGDSLNIGGWKIEDENGNYFILSKTNFILPANSFFILSADSSIINKYSLENYSSKNILSLSSLGLSNSGELILLKDLKGNVIDSVKYSDKWHNQNFLSTKNISLERINPSLSGNDPLNWSSSANSLGATPGFVNSIFTEGKKGESNISVSPNPFSPDNGGFEDFTIINYNLTQETAQVRVKVFDSKGRLVRTIVNNQASGQNGSIIFNGLDDDNNPLRIGIYIVFIEALNSNSGLVETLKTTVVIARKL